jgi:hypothetical protein
MKHHTIKSYARVEVQLHTFLTSSPDRGNWGEELFYLIWELDYYSSAIQSIDPRCTDWPKQASARESYTLSKCRNDKMKFIKGT